MKLARKLAEQNAPLAQINDLLQAANIPVMIAIRAGEDVRAVRVGGVEYGVSELLDGERNALLVAANVPTARPGTLILVDEPERHLHRSIISPLLTHLFAARPDCSFVISIHEVMLPVNNPALRTLLVRSCAYADNVAVTWEADLLQAGAEIDEEVRRDILGARRTIVFVEGGPGSLDRPLYALLFPSASVVAKSSCRDVGSCRTTPWPDAGAGRCHSRPCCGSTSSSNGAPCPIPVSIWCGDGCRYLDIPGTRREEVRWRRMSTMLAADRDSGEPQLDSAITARIAREDSASEWGSLPPR